MRFRRCAGALALTGLVAACGARAEGGFHPSGRIATTDRSAESSTTHDGAGAAAPSGVDGATAIDRAQPKTPEAALAAYRTYHHIYEKVYETGDPAPLSAVAVDPQLSRVAKDVRKVRSQGVIWRFHNVLNPRVQGRSADGTTVVILDCVRTLGAYRYSAASGERLGALRGGTFLYQAIMRFTDGSWKISDARQGGKC